MDEIQQFKALLCAMITRAALDLIQKPSCKRRHTIKDKTYNYLIYSDRQSKKDIVSAAEFLKSDIIQCLIEEYNIEISIEAIRQKCGLK